MPAISLRHRVSRTRRVALVLSITAALFVFAPVAAVPANAAAEGGEHHEESLASFLSRVVNSALLFGGLYYLLRRPLADHLVRRAEQVRVDLATARDTRANASVQLEAIEAKLRELPGELEALRRRGAEEIAAEQARIVEQTAVERERLLEQTRREVEQRVRTARRELTALAANLSVDVARRRLAAQMTAADQLRLIDRCAVQMRSIHE